MQDLFGEERVVIPDNKPLEQAANLILHLVNYTPEILDGKSMGEIDRDMYFHALMGAGLNSLLTHDQVQSVRALMHSLKGYQDSDTLRRARRWLLQNDYIRVSKEAILDAEKQKARIAGAMH